MIDFACSDGRGNWDDGRKTFIDPVPADMVIRRVSINLFGRFDCQVAQLIRQPLFFSYDIFFSSFCNLMPTFW